MEHNASEHSKSFVVATGSPKKREILLTKDNHRVSARFSYKRGMELCVYQSLRWRDAIVRDEAVVGNVCRLQLVRRDSEETEETSTVLNPFNHGI